MSCVYLGERTDQRGVYVCRLHGRCTPGGSCADRLSLDDPGFASAWRDPLMVTDRRQNEVSCMRDLLAGAPAFLVCGGPSANGEPLEQLNWRGVWCLAVNNMAGHPRFRPQAFICADPPKKFSHSIWLDPGIMKWVPTPKLRGVRAKLRRKLPNGCFEKLERRTFDCPNVWGFRRHSWLTPDEQFFLSDGALWGNHKAGVERTGEEKTVCTMLLGLRLLYYLGSRRVYLVGADFRMRPDYGYSFGQERTEEACRSNNAQFAVVNRWLCTMQERGVFERFGLEVYNTYERSSLRAFPYVPFGKAVEDCRGEVELIPDLSGWYEK